MSVATTPSQIKAECSGVPTKGTIVIIESRTDTLTFVVAMDQLRLIVLFKELVASHRAWSPEIMKAIVRTTPTCPLPKHPVKELSRIVRFSPTVDAMEWTEDAWGTAKSFYYCHVTKSWTYSDSVLNKGRRPIKINA